MSDIVLELHDVVVEYDGRAVLDIPHLAVYRGEILTLLGENGSGKTTLLRLLGLLVRPGRGRVVFHGEDVDYGSARRLLELRRRMAAVMQEPLLCRMNVRSNVALGLRFRRIPKTEIYRRVQLWLERLSISHLAGRPASKLSGGESQRTSLARAMVVDPEVLFLDEPFASLDAPTRQSQLQEFQAVLAESGVTAVFATHDRGEALGLGDRVAVLMHGGVVQVDSAESVFSRPQRVDVARFVGIETLIPGRVERSGDGLVRVDCGKVAVMAEGDFETGEDVCVAVRPEEISLHCENSDDIQETLNVFSGTVRKVVPAETHYRVEVECRVPMVAAISRGTFRNMRIEVGQSIRAAFSARSAHIIKNDNK